MGKTHLRREVLLVPYNRTSLTRLTSEHPNTTKTEPNQRNWPPRNNWQNCNNNSIWQPTTLSNPLAYTCVTNAVPPEEKKEPTIEELIAHIKALLTDDSDKLLEKNLGNWVFRWPTPYDLGEGLKD